MNSRATIASLADLRPATVSAVVRRPIGKDEPGSPTSSAVFAKYRDALATMPVPGDGVHGHMMRCADLGVMAGCADREIEADLRAVVQPERQRQRPHEIAEALHKARRDVAPLPTGHQAWKPSFSTVRAPPDRRRDWGRIRGEIIARGGGAIEPDSAALWESSPVRIDWPPQEDAYHLMRLLYHPTDHLFVGTGREWGDEQRRHVRTAAEWQDFFDRCQRKAAETANPNAHSILGGIYPHFIPNPLTGEMGMTKDGRPTLRGDACVKEWRYAVGEFDGIPQAEQIAFWSGIGVPLVALIDSGSRSIHAWVRICARDAAEWTELVEGKLFGMLTALGIDRACKNESRLSRTPGVFRPEKNQWQRLLWLCPEGRPLAL